MLRRIIFPLLIIIFLINSAYAEKVKKIIISGNERVSSDTIKLFGDIKINNDYDSTGINEILKKLYETNFFKDVKVSLKNNVLNISVSENPIISEIILNGIKADKIKDPLLESMSLKKNTSFIEYLAKDDKSNMTAALKQAGYYFADVQLSIIENSNNSVDLIYDIDLGKKAKIKKIKFIGDKKFKNRKLFKVIVSEENKFWKFLSTKKLLNQSRIDLDRRLLESFYKNKGYYNVKIESSFAKFLDQGNFDLIFNINAGEKFYFKEIKLNIPDGYERKNFSNIDKVLKKISNKTYSYNSIEKILKQVEKIALTEEYESINANVVEEIVENNKINFTITLEELPKQFVERINIMGNNITRENVLRNNLVLDEGDAFNKILHNKSLNNLKSLNFFKSVESEILDSEVEGKKIININVEEKPTGEISAGAGVGTSGGTVGFGVKENNFLGRGIEFASNLDVTDESIRGKFTLTNPNYRGMDRKLFAGAQSSETDRMTAFGYKTTKTGFNLGTSFEYYEDFYVAPAFTAFYESLKTSSTASSNMKKQEGNYFDTDFNYSIDYDKRNQKFQPTEGYRSRFDQSIPLISDTNAIMNGYEFNYYNELVNDIVGSFSLYYRAINSMSGDDVRVSERLFMPQSKLRGFEAGKIGPVDNNDYLGGNYLSALNFVATLPNAVPTLQNADFSVFLDAGNIWGVDYDSTINDSSALRSSLGLAIDWYTPVGPLSFSYAEVLSKKSSDKIENFRFNLGTTF